MMLKKAGNRGYATIKQNDGVNYREIAETMTELGYPMNHSSARNHLVRVMIKFLDAIVDEYDIASDVDQFEIVKSPQFQRGIHEILSMIEVERRSKANVEHCQ